MLYLLALFLLLVLAAGIWVANSPLASESLCDKIRQALGQALGKPVTTGKCSIDIIPPALEVASLRVGSESERPWFEVSRLRVELDSLSLLGGRLALSRVRLWEPRVRWQVTTSGIVGLPSPAASGQGQAAAGNWLPERLELFRGQVDLALPGSRRVRLSDLQVQIDDLGDGEMAVHLSAGGGTLFDQRLGDPWPLDELQVTGVAGAESVFLEHLSLRSAGFSMQGSLQLELAAPEGGAGLAWLPPGWRPRGRLRLQLPLTELARWWPAGGGRGVLDVDVTTEQAGRLITVAARGEKIALAGTPPFSLDVRVTVSAEEVALERLVVKREQASLAGHGRMKLREPFAFSVDLKTSELAVGRWLSGLRLPVAIQSRVSGDISLEGSLAGRRGPRVVARSDLQLKHTVIRWQAQDREWNGSWPVANLQGQVHCDGQGLRWNDIHWQLGASSVLSSGYLDWRRGLVKLDGRAAPLLLADLAGSGGVPLAGQGQLEVHLEREREDYRGKVDFAMHGVKLGQRHLGQARGTVRLGDGLARLDNLTLRGPGGRLFINGKAGLRAPYPLGLVVDLAEARLADLLTVVQGERPPAWLDGRVGGRVLVSGDLAAPALALQVAARQIRVGPQLVDEAGLVGHLEGGSWHLDLLEARLGPGWIYARGDITPGLELDVSVYSTGLRANSFSWLPGGGALDFRLDLHMGVKGRLLAPQITGWAKVYDTRLEGRSLGDSFVSARATTESIKVQGRFFGRQLRVDASMLTEPFLPFTARLDFDLPELARLLPLGQGGNFFAARLAGHLQARGLVLRPLQSQGQLLLEKLSLVLAGARLQADGQWRLQLRGGQLQLEPLRLIGRQASMRLSGTCELGSGPRLLLEGRASLRLLPRWFNWLQRAQGRVSFSLGWGGSWMRPQMQGQVRITARDVKFAPWPQPLQQLSAKVHLDGRGMEFVSINGKVGGGTISGLGRLEWSGGTVSGLNLSLDLNRVQSRITSSLVATVSGSLNLSKPPGHRPRLAGYLNLHQGSYREKITLTGLSQGLFRRRLLPTRAYDTGREVLDLDMRVHVPDTLEVDYDLGLIRFTAEMGGQLRVSGSNERLGLLGELEAKRGQVRYLTRDFQLRRSLVRFLDEFSILPRVDLVADLLEVVDRGEEEGGKTEYRIELRVQAEGDKQPTISLDSDPPLDERDIVTLLNLGVTSQDVKTLRGEDLVGLGGEILARSLALDEKLRRIFPFPPQVVQPKYLRVRSRYSTSSRAQRQGAVSPRLEVGARLNFVSPDLELDYGRSLYDDADQNLDLSYRISRNVSARLRWENAEQDSPLVDVGDIGLDLRLRWEW